MGNFIVSARKYRPSRFEDVIGQELVTTTLINSIKNNHLAQSFLFCGPRGVGKTTCARILAAIINCENYTEKIAACGQCPSCKSFNENSSFNIHELDAASNNSVDDIRNLIDQVRYPPQTGKYKVYIIDEVHMLSQSAFNAFLKTLEEPPSYAIFILATTEKHKIIPTILSRCQIFDFNRIRQDDIVTQLQHISDKENIQADLEGLHIIAQKADGSLRDALSIFDRLVSYSGGQIIYKDVLDNLDILDYDYYFRITDCFATEDISGVLNIFDEILRKGFDEDIFINGLATHFRDLLVCKNPDTIHLLNISDSLKDRYLQSASQTPSSFLINAINIINQCDINYRMSKNQRLHVELALIKLTYLNTTISMSTIIPADDEQSKKKQIKSPAKEVKDQQITTENESKKTPHIESQHEPSPNLTKLPNEHSENKPSINVGKPVISSTPLTSLDKFSKQVIEEVNAQKYSNNPVNELSGSTQDNNTGNIEPQKLIEGWQSFCHKIKSLNRMSLYSFMESVTPVLDDKGSIEVVVENALMQQQLIDIKQDLIDHLQKELQYSPFQINIKIKEKSDSDAKNKRPFTAKEKFDTMAEKNPALKNLVKKLDLDLEL